MISLLSNGHCLVALLIAGGFASLICDAAPAAPKNGDMAYDALIKKYWDPEMKFFRKEERGRRKADFWLSAQLWDTVMDQYDRTKSREVKRLIGEVYDGFVKEHPDWTTNKYNDDIMWWSIACTRAYKITGEKRYLDKAKASFDFVYDNFHDSAMGGGIYWINERTCKNSCINSPAVIAAVRLSILLKDPAYLAKAKSLYAWQKETLTDGTGKVFDNIEIEKETGSPRIARFSLTYNQGTFIGAAVLLYQQTKEKAYLEDAVKTAQWTHDHLCRTEKRILQPEGQGDGGAFKGIFIRYIKLLIDDCGRKEFLPWMMTNAETAWSNRREADNIMGFDWSAPTGPGIESQTAGSAVTAVLVFGDDRGKTKKTNR
jgi:predicted alpha-1,6-mannanase (GH76 family)